ncbi:MAG: hypothetical protein ACTSSH_10205 [Candidatus Heimdallarchaeota archaeon]
MNEKKDYSWKLICIRIVLWIGIAFDFISALATTIYMLSPTDTFINDIFGYSPISDITISILAFETSLMWGWTALLFWADRKPLERRGVLLLTAFPVVAFMLSFNAVGFSMGNPFIPIFIFVIQPILLVLLGSAYFFAAQLTKQVNVNQENVTSG